MNDAKPDPLETILSFNSLDTAQTSLSELTRPNVGERLQQARINHGLTVNDLAQSLRLSSRQIEALEAGDWAKLPGPTFVRGFVRNYARRVGIPPEPLLNDLKFVMGETTQKLERQPCTGTVLPTVGQTNRKNYALFFLALLLIGVTAVAYFHIPADIWENPSAAEKENTNVAPAEIADNLLTQPIANPVTPSATPEENKEAAPISPSTTAVSPTTGITERGHLQFTFSQAAWVEISDKTGKIIFSQLNQAGTQRDVFGFPPFSITIGNAKNVHLHYKGREIELQPRSKDDVVRLNLE